MAEYNKSHYDIVTLQVELLPTRPDLRFTLQFRSKGRFQSLDETWGGDTSDLGFGSGSRSSERFPRDEAGTLPREMLEGVKSWLQENTDGSTPLWVHLVKPYGVLRFVPWERRLGEALGVPILMIPDFLFPPPRETTAMLEVALCGSAPLNSEEHWVYEAVRTAAVSIVLGSPRPTRLHCFVDAHFAPTLRDELRPPYRDGSEIVIHGHDLAMPYVEADPASRLVDSGGRIRSPWLLWMRDALRGRSVDVVHFACHGHLARDSGAMLFAQSPVERTDRYLAGPVAAIELSTFLTQVGAWSSAFTSVFDDNSPPGLRALADEIAQSRPGPMIMHNFGLDSSGDALRDAYRFVYDAHPAEAPKSTALFIYCQPYRVKGATPQEERGDAASGEEDDTASEETLTFAASMHAGNRPAVLRNIAQAVQVVAAEASSPLDALLTGSENAPPWVAATARFAEQVKLELQETARDDLTPAPMFQRQAAVTMNMLDRLQQSVARHVARQEREGSGRSGEAR